MSQGLCVIGSGPAAMAAAHTLAKTGATVTILDVGFTLDPDSRDLLARYREHADRQRLLRGIHALRRSNRRHSAVQPGKALFGSEYPFRTLDETEITAEDAVVRSSLAEGGLSAVWGATVSTAVPRDLDDWPIGFGDLEPHYRGLDEILSVSSPAGELDGIFPLEIGREPTFPLGAQGRDLLDRLDRHRPALTGDGLHVGRAKLAVGPRHSSGGEGCRPCGLCMHGCPRRAIFNAAYVLEDLRRQPNVIHRPGTLVESLSESDGGVRVHVRNLEDGGLASHDFDRVFLGCGVFNTTAIVARSLGLTDHEFTILDSQKYIFPLLRRNRSKGAVRADENTLAQVYLLVDNADVSRRVVQVQYYGYNDLLLDPLRQRLGDRVAALVPRALASLLERTMITFVYLHSEESGRLQLRVDPLGQAGGRLGTVRGVRNPRSDEVIRSLLAVLKRHRRAHGGWPVSSALQTTLPGDSQHIGGSFPMSRSPGRTQTDTLGRPGGSRRIHIVDASVFPTVPATPIAYTSMANASRIASEVARELA